MINIIILLLLSSCRQMVFPSYLLLEGLRRCCLDCDFFLSLKRNREEILHDRLLINAKKTRGISCYLMTSRLLCRDYWTRTSDLAPPRRVRYQLRQIPIAYALLNICGCKGMILFWNEQIFNRFLQFFRILLCFFSDSWWTFCSFTLLY